MTLTSKDIYHYLNHLNDISDMLLYSMSVLLCRDDAMSITTILFTFFLLDWYYPSLYLLVISENILFIVHYISLPMRV